MSRIFFPLRTSVEFFVDPTSVAAITRAKEAAILYDELVFEDGLYEIGITEDGSFANWRPPGGITADELARSRQLPEPGSGMEIRIGVQPGFGIPAIPEAMNPFITGQLTASYVAEWQTGVIEELRPLKPSWASTVVMGEQDPNLDALKPAIREATNALERGFPPDQASSQVLRSFQIGTLARDSALAANMGAALNITSLFMPLLAGSDAVPDPSGRTALGILAPNVGALPWEAIVEFREHPGSDDARGILREFEQKALAADPGDPLAFQHEVFREVSERLMAVIKDLRGSLSANLVEEAAKTGVSFIPIVGPFLGPGTSLAEALYEANQQRRSWYAAIMKLAELASQAAS